MQHINATFSQLLAEIPRYKFNKVVKRYDGAVKVEFSIMIQQGDFT